MRNACDGPSTTLGPGVRARNWWRQRFARLSAPTLCLRLPERATGSFDAGAGSTTIEVRTGRVWITSAADACDRVVDTGEHVTIREAGRVVMTSLLDSHLLVRAG